MSKPILCRKCDRIFTGEQASAAMTSHYYREHLRKNPEPQSQEAVNVIAKLPTDERPVVAIFAATSRRKRQAKRSTGRKIIASLPNNAQVVSLCAEGEERHYYAAARERGLSTLKITPRWKEQGKDALVEAVQRIAQIAHAVVVFHDNDSRSRFIARAAKKQGKPVFPIDIDGKLDNSFNPYANSPRSYRSKQRARTQPKPPKHLRSLPPPNRSSGSSNSA